MGMLEIAGGILLAVAALAALPFVLAGAYWALVIGVGLAIVTGGWFALDAILGPAWAWGICIDAYITAVAWSELPEDKKSLLILLKTFLLTGPISLLRLGVWLAGIAALGLVVIGMSTGFVILTMLVLGPFGLLAGLIIDFGAWMVLKDWWRRSQTLPRIWATVSSRWNSFGLGLKRDPAQAFPGIGASRPICQPGLPIHNGPHDAPSRSWTDADVSKLCNEAAMKLGDAEAVKVIITEHVPFGEVPHSRNIPADQREAFAMAVKRRLGISFA